MFCNLCMRDLSNKNQKAKIVDVETPAKAEEELDIEMCKNQKAKIVDVETPAKAEEEFGPELDKSVKACDRDHAAKMSAEQDLITKVILSFVELAADEVQKNGSFKYGKFNMKLKKERPRRHKKKFSKGVNPYTKEPCSFGLELPESIEECGQVANRIACLYCRDCGQPRQSEPNLWAEITSALESRLDPSDPDYDTCVSYEHDIWRLPRLQGQIIRAIARRVDVSPKQVKTIITSHIESAIVELENKKKFKFARFFTLHPQGHCSPASRWANVQVSLKA